MRCFKYLDWNTNAKLLTHIHKNIFSDRMNKSDYEKLSEWNSELAKHYIVNDIILGFYLILGISGNAIVVIIYTFRMKRKKDDRYFIPFLAGVDLCACATRSILELVMNINPVNFQGSALCKFVWFPTNVSAVASIFLLLVIALQRYLKVCRPFGSQMTLLGKRIALVACILVSVGVSAPLIVYNDEIKVVNPENNITGYVCDTDVKNSYGHGFLVYIIFASACSLALMIALTVLNVCIGKTIYKQLKAKKDRKYNKNVVRFKVSACVNSALMENDQPDISECISETEPSFKVSVHTTTTVQTFNQIQYHSSNDSDQNNISKMSFSHRYSFMFMAIGIAFIISYSPRLILLFITLDDPKFFGKITQTQLTILSIIREMNVVNNVVNPFIYGFFDHAFRKETKKLFCYSTPH